MEGKISFLPRYVRRFRRQLLHWGFGNLVAADHSRVSEWRDCPDFDAERYACIFEEATKNAGVRDEIRSHLLGNARIYNASEALEANDKNGKPS
jgi:ATP-dependent Clp protease, protease subunit